MTELFEEWEGFQWDQGNLEKSWIRHQVTNNECEQVFFNKPFIVADDSKHSQREKRWYILGRTDSNRLLFVVFTIRENLIRVISARNMNKTERRKYNGQIKRHS